MASIAAERLANQRAQAEGYASAAAKEMHANARASSGGFANAVQQEIDANRRAQAAGFKSAADQEIDANRRSQAAGFKSAVDQEIDANRRARASGWLNAADLELHGPEGATRSNAPFVDPRSRTLPTQYLYGASNPPVFPQQYQPFQAYNPLTPIQGLLGSLPPLYASQPVQTYNSPNFWDTPYQEWPYNYPRKKFNRYL